MTPELDTDASELMLPYIFGQRGDAMTPELDTDGTMRRDFRTSGAIRCERARPET